MSKTSKLRLENKYGLEWREKNDEVDKERRQGNMATNQRHRKPGALTFLNASKAAAESVEINNSPRSRNAYIEVIWNRRNA